MNIAVIIPARYASSRLPGKPLIQIAGRTMIERVWRIADSVSGVHSVVVATDDERIFQAVQSFGGRAVLTPENCKNGTERALAALEALPETIDAVINFQGDAVLTPPWILEALAESMRVGQSNAIYTPAVELSRAEYQQLLEEKVAGSSSGTLVVFDVHKRALYFSKFLIPFVRDEDQLTDPTGIFRHIGMYGYTRETLEKYVTLPETPLERLEGLEQLRALEHGMPIQVVQVEYRGRSHASVDNSADVALVEQIIAKEGELIS